MKIKLTQKQYGKIAAVFSTLKTVKSDKNLIKQIKFVCSKDFNEVNAVRDGTLNEDTENDYYILANFYDDLKDSCEEFNYWED